MAWRDKIERLIGSDELLRKKKRKTTDEKVEVLERLLGEVRNTQAHLEETVLPGTDRADLAEAIRALETAEHRLLRVLSRYEGRWTGCNANRLAETEVTHGG